MAGLMDMYAAFNAPQVSTGDYANVQQRKNDLQSRRFSGLGNMLIQNSLGTLQQEYRAGTGRFAGLDPDRKFQVYYDALKAIDPATAETEQARYNTERQRRVGSEVASAYTSGGREPAVARFMQDNPELGIKLATDPASGALKEEDRLATQWRTLMATKNKKDFETLDRATKERINSQISGLESALSRTEYGKSLIGGGGAPASVAGEVTETKTDQFYTPAVSAEIENLIGEFDDKETATVEGVANVKLWLAQLREKAGISESDPEYKMMVDYIGNAASGREQAVKEKRAEEERKLGLRAKEVGIEQQKAAADQSGGSVDKREATLKIDQILANPNDPTVIADGVLWYVRKKSGAMIGPTEILQYMQGKLPQEKYNELLKELSPTGLKAIAGYVAGSSTSEPIIAAITAKYTPFIKKDRLINDINIWAQKKDLGKNTEAPKTQSTKKTSGKTQSGSTWVVE